MRSIFLCIGWLATGAAFAYLAVAFAIHWALIGFSPKYDLESLGLGVGALLLLIGFAFLARASGDWGSQVVSFVVCLALMALARFALQPDVDNTFVVPRPLWFRGGLAAVLSVPSVIWCWSLARTWRKRG
jgi:hypothetical protein